VKDKLLTFCRGNKFLFCFKFFGGVKAIFLKKRVFIYLNPLDTTRKIFWFLWFCWNYLFQLNRFVDNKKHF
jgi:hypothetical protein